MRATLLANIDLCTPFERVRGAEILVENGRIAYAGPKRRARNARTKAATVATIDGRGALAVPGLVDIHLHGGGGADFMDGTAEAVRTVARTHARAGTTSIVATLMTARPAALRAAVGALNEAGEGTIVGLHLEGPHIAAAKRGAQPADAIRPLGAAEVDALIRLSRVPLRIVTLAPEMPGSTPLIRALLRRGVLPAAGHSAATFEQAIRGFEAGISHGTHLFNAMSGIHHRDPGLAGALLLNEEASVELIADGVHLHPAAVFLVLAAKPADRVILVTDATRPAGSRTAPLRTPDGRLYGSTLTLIEAVRNIVRWSGWPIEAVLPLATANPARLLGIDDRKGFLKRGRDADIVLLDRRLGVLEVFRGGERTLRGR